MSENPNVPRVDPTVLCPEPDMMWLFWLVVFPLFGSAAVFCFIMAVLSI